MAKNIGELSVLLGADTEVYQQKMKKSKSDLQSFGDSAKDIAAKFAVAFASIVGAVKSAEVVIKSTQATADEWDAVMGGLTEQTNKFATSIATMDFSNFLSGLRDAYDAGRKYAQQQDEILDRKNSVSISSAETELAIAKLSNESRKASTSVARQKEIAAEINRLTADQANREKDIAAEKLQSEKDLISAKIAGLKEYSQLSENENKKMTDELVEYIRNYKELGDTELKKVNEYLNSTQKEMPSEFIVDKTTGKTFKNSAYNDELIAYQKTQAIYNSLSEVQLRFIELGPALNLIVDEQRATLTSAYVELANTLTKIEMLGSKATRAENKAGKTGVAKSFNAIDGDVPLEMESWMEDFWKIGNKIPESIPAIDFMDAEFGKIPDTLKKYFEKAESELMEFSNSVNDELESLIEGSITDFAMAMGQSFVSGDWSNFGADMLRGLGQWAVNLGSLLIASGIALEALYKADPLTKIVAGIALVGIGSALSAIASSPPKSGSSYSNVGTSIGGSNSSGNSNRTIELVWKRAGKDLVAIMKDENTAYKTITGYR